MRSLICEAAILVSKLELYGTLAIADLSDLVFIVQMRVFSWLLVVLFATTTLIRQVLSTQASGRWYRQKGRAVNYSHLVVGFLGVCLWPELIFN